MIAARLAANPERKFIVRRQIDRQLSMRNGITGGLGQIELEHQCPALRAARFVNRSDHAIGRSRAPGADVVELIEDARFRHGCFDGLRAADSNSDERNPQRLQAALRRTSC